MDASSSGLVMAARAALTDRPSPVAEPMPMMAVPALLMIIFTSAKSVLIRPGTVIRLVIPCTPCMSTSSAILKALTIDVFSLDTVSSRSLGMMMRVSTFSFRFWMPCFGLDRAAAALEGERTGDHADGQRAERTWRSRPPPGRRRCRCHRPCRR